MISIDEFCELSKHTGLAKAQMRASFREADIGHAGQLSPELVSEVLQQLRNESNVGHDVLGRVKLRL
jgi:hypothetical protein